MASTVPKSQPPPLASCRIDNGRGNPAAAYPLLGLYLCAHLGAQGVNTSCPPAFQIWRRWVSLAEPIGYPELSWQECWGNAVFSHPALMCQGVGLQEPYPQWERRLRANREEPAWWAWGKGLNIHLLTPFYQEILSHYYPHFTDKNVRTWKHWVAWHMSASNGVGESDLHSGILTQKPTFFGPGVFSLEITVEDLKRQCIEWEK